jgi:hypothetical protein
MHIPPFFSLYKSSGGIFAKFLTLADIVSLPFKIHKRLKMLLEKNGDRFIADKTNFEIS